MLFELLLLECVGEDGRFGLVVSQLDIPARAAKEEKIEGESHNGSSDLLDLKSEGEIENQTLCGGESGNFVVLHILFADHILDLVYALCK